MTGTPLVADRVRVTTVVELFGRDSDMAANAQVAMALDAQVAMALDAPQYWDMVPTAVDRLGAA